MRVVLASVGTRGDIQPMAALAQALVCRGHEALIACPATFGPWITSLGLEHQPLGEDLTAKMQESGGKLERSLAGMKQYFTEQMLARWPSAFSGVTRAQPSSRCWRRPRRPLLGARPRDRADPHPEARPARA